MPSSMQISVAGMRKKDDPYRLFCDTVTNKETRRKYIGFLKQFLNEIPDEIYLDALGKKPMCQEIGTLADSFVELAKKDSELAHAIIVAYIRQKNTLVHEGRLNPNTVPNHIKPIRALLDSVGPILNWKSLYKLYLPEKKSEDRAYTREELQGMLECASDITDKVIVTLFSSSGVRKGAWDYFTWKDVIFFKNDNGTYKGAALWVYRGEPECYSTFITPEACNMLESYRELWKSQTGKYPTDNDPLLKTAKSRFVERLTSDGVKKRVNRLAKKIGLRTSLEPGKKRHDVALDHGFRKYFNTMLRRAKVNYLDKEDMMGHSVGLEKHYERYNEEDFERFSEYQKAIPFLTISDTERLRFEKQQLEKEKSSLEQQIPKMVEEITKRVKIELAGNGWKSIDSN